MHCYSTLSQVFCLLTPSPKYERVSAFESQNTGSFLRKLAKQGVNLILRTSVQPCLLANIHHVGPRMHKPQDVMRHEPAATHHEEQFISCHLAAVVRCNSG